MTSGLWNKWNLVASLKPWPKLTMDPQLVPFSVSPSTYIDNSPSFLVLALREVFLSPHIL